ncbi:tRNA (guanosine(18)-2'-O)-methyltransferase TrmH [Endozoicomonas elysicola]|uniref:tRNA (guanosine(18)-2'-O)-methyltransferase n=1 Tax=Endozoicomonas elysicola TaxID=305900 RepID=A0A081K8K4_9GAMM|nr:tRNA (guanosine(18)-2'-O)-methyltransferase TrmH [Endozoicomonas elysicola]KEI70480.1 tRNA guanosine-2'-O-methyltransferase [Endozoicomonas elysicola]
MTPERYQKFCKVLDRRQPDLTVLTDQVHKTHNLSAIIRTCDAIGIHELHMTQPKRGHRQYRRRSMGSHRWVEIHDHSSIEDSASHLQNRGFKLFAAHFSAKSIPFYEIDFTQPCAIILGAEKDGISPEAAELADEHMVIPMVGQVASFNVSVAAAIILVEAQRQRAVTGFYDNRRLNDDVYRKTLFRWGYPELTRYCDERNLDYPEIDDSGQLVDPSQWYSQVCQPNP